MLNNFVNIWQKCSLDIAKIFIQTQGLLSFYLLGITLKSGTNLCQLVPLQRTVTVNQWRWLNERHARFISPDMWPLNDPDLSLVDYMNWGVLRERVYKLPMKGVTSRKRVEADIDRSTLCNAAVCHRQAINEWRKCLCLCLSERRPVLRISYKLRINILIYWLILLSMFVLLLI